MGWIGSADELKYALKMFGAERDAAGNVLIVKGTEIASFMGAGEEIVIGDDLFCRVNGQNMNIAYLMSQTSYGMSVTVIM